MKGDRDECPIIRYGSDGPAFERLCPNCGRFLPFPEIIRYRVDFNDMCHFEPVKCSKCGPVQPNHVGWAEDYV